MARQLVRLGAVVGVVLGRCMGMVGLAGLALPQLPLSAGQAAAASAPEQLVEPEQRPLAVQVVVEQELVSPELTAMQP